MVTQLILILCLANNPTQCIERPVDGPDSVMGAMVAGQQIAADYINQHPQYTLHGFRIVLGGKREGAA